MVAPNSKPEKSDEKESMVEFVIVLPKKWTYFYTETRYAVINCLIFKGFSYHIGIYNFSVHTQFC